MLLAQTEEEQADVDAERSADEAGL